MSSQTVTSPIITSPIVKQVSGPAAGLQLASLRAAGLISSPFHHRGMQRFTWTIGYHVFDEHNSAILDLPGGGKIKIYLRDGYWTRLLLPGFQCEPDLAFLLKRAIMQPNVYLLDCGANIGYWSVVASRFLPADHIVAVEAAPPNFAQLEANARLNDGGFVCVLNALWKKDGEELTIVSHDLRHAGSSVVNRRDKVGKRGYREHKVPSVSIDSLCQRYVADPNALIVLKLDVEGAEIQALEGAQSVLRNRQVFLLYEDHGQDPDCKISGYFMNQLGYEVFHCDDANKVTRMRSLEDVRRLKTDVSGGYNFVTCTPGSIFSDMLHSG